MSCVGLTPSPMFDACSATTLDSVIRSPFARLNTLLNGDPPGDTPINFSLGEPQMSPPPFVQPVLTRHLAEFGRYPPIRGTVKLREAIVEWMERRYPVLKGAMDPERHVLPLNGSREGLFSAIFPARARKPNIVDPCVLIPNPFYQVYAAAAAVAGASPVFLPSTEETGFLPALERIEGALFERTLALYLCSPSNPEGAVANREYLAQAISLARRHDFLLFADECYSEIYSSEPPPGALEVALAETGGFANVLSLGSAPASSPAIPPSSTHLAASGTSPAPKSRCPSSMFPPRPGRTRSMSKRDGRSRKRISTPPIRFSRADMATAAQGEVSFYG